MFAISIYRPWSLKTYLAVGYALLLLSLPAVSLGQTSPPAAHRKLLRGSPQSRLEEAKELLKPLVRADPDNPDYLFDLGDVYLLMGRPKNAIPLLKKSLYLLPTNWNTRMALAQAYQETNNDADALQILGRIPPRGPKAQLWAFTRAFSLFRLGDIRTALPMFKQLLGNKGMQAPANFFVANCYSEMAKYQAALPYYRAAIKFGQGIHNKALNAYYYDYGLSLFKLGDYQESRDAFEKSIQRYANDPLPWYYLGRCEANLRNFAKARNSFETAIKKDSSFNPAYYRLARLYAEHGDKEKAHEYYSKVSNELQQQLVESQRLKLGGRSPTPSHHSKGKTED